MRQSKRHNLGCLAVFKPDRARRINRFGDYFNGCLPTAITARANGSMTVPAEAYEHRAPTWLTAAECNEVSGFYRQTAIQVFVFDSWRRSLDLKPTPLG